MHLAIRNTEIPFRFPKCRPASREPFSMRHAVGVRHEDRDIACKDIVGVKVLDGEVVYAGVAYAFGDDGDWGESAAMTRSWLPAVSSPAGTQLCFSGSQNG